MTQPTPEEIAAQKAKIMAQSGKTPDELREELVALKAKAPEDLESRMEASFAKEAEGAKAQETGEDLDFDIDAFIKEGVVAKKNIKLFDKLYVDMQTLTQTQRMMCEQMVRERFGNMPQDNIYALAIEAAMLAMSVTRMNNHSFGIPPFAGSTPETLGLRKQKLYLFEKFMNSPADFIRALSVLYSNLALADLMSEADQKK